MAELRPLWGNDPSALAASRSPFGVAQLLREVNLACLDVRHTPPMWAEGVHWLRKPLRSAAGRDISFADELPATKKHADRRFYFQRYIEGPSYSAVFVGDPVGAAYLLGVTQQLVGECLLNAKSFQYCGNIGPIELTDSVLAALQRIGEVLTTGCHLRGLFGIDFILNEDGPWLVEVNPRYTASVEVLEYATDTAFLSLHRNAFEPSSLVRSPRPFGRDYFGKAILYARKRIVMLANALSPQPPFDPERPFVMPAAADIPSIGEAIEPGWPICTVFARGSSIEECHQQLLQHARGIYELVLGD
jgi:predicted ATP-grasp superfamily ATP-dependent carboligase